LYSLKLNLALSACCGQILTSTSKGEHMKKLLPAAIAAMMLAGCATQYSETPLAGNFATTKQNKLQASSHWLLIAKDVAEQIKLGTDKVGAPVYVTPPAQNSKFAQVFYDEIITSLVNQGVTVRRVHDMTVQVVDIDTQLLHFSTNRTQNRRFTSMTALAGGIAALYGVNWATGTKEVIGGLAATGSYDWLNWVDQEYASGRTPSYELVITTSLTKNSQYLARRTDVYYINDNDATLYNKESDFSFKVVGGE